MSTDADLSDDSSKTAGQVSNEKSGTTTNANEQYELREGYTSRFFGFVSLTGLLIAGGVLAYNPAALVGSTVLLAFLLGAVLQRTPTISESLNVEYAVAPESPRPGETVYVTLTLHNTGTTRLVDLRVVDQVPDRLKVIEGIPRATVSLNPGESSTFEYAVRARRGTFVFGPPEVRTRSFIGSVWAQQPVSPETTPSFSCMSSAEDLDLEDRASLFLGTLLSQEGGEGIEFHSSREYHYGDPVSRINWQTLAKRNELSTITFREQEAGYVTLLVDLRDQTYTNAAPGSPEGATLGLYAAQQVFTTLTQQGHYVGALFLGLDDSSDVPSTIDLPFEHVDHTRDPDNRWQFVDLFDRVDSRRPTASSSLSRRSTIDIDELRLELSMWERQNAQYILISPLLDDDFEELATDLRSRGSPTFMISPDTIIAEHETNSPATRLANSHRMSRLEELQMAGCTAVNWHPSQPLSRAINEQLGP